MKILKNLNKIVPADGLQSGGNTVAFLSPFLVRDVTDVTRLRGPTHVIGGQSNWLIDTVPMDVGGWIRYVKGREQ